MLSCNHRQFRGKALLHSTNNLHRSTSYLGGTLGCFLTGEGAFLRHMDGGSRAPARGWERGAQRAPQSSRDTETAWRRERERYSQSGPETKDRSLDAYRDRLRERQREKQQEAPPPAPAPVAVQEDEAESSESEVVQYVATSLPVAAPASVQRVVERGGERGRDAARVDDYWAREREREQRRGYDSRESSSYGSSGRYPRERERDMGRRDSWGRRQEYDRERGASSRSQYPAYSDSSRSRRDEYSPRDRYPRERYDERTSRPAYRSQPSDYYDRHPQGRVVERDPYPRERSRPVEPRRQGWEGSDPRSTGYPREQERTQVRYPPFTTPATHHHVPAPAPAYASPAYVSPTAAPHSVPRVATGWGLQHPSAAVHEVPSREASREVSPAKEAGSRDVSPLAVSHLISSGVHQRQPHYSSAASPPSNRPAARQLAPSPPRQADTRPGKHDVDTRHRVMASPLLLSSEDEKRQTRAVSPSPSSIITPARSDPNSSRDALLLRDVAMAPGTKEKLGNEEVAKTGKSLVSMRLDSLKKKKAREKREKERKQREEQRKEKEREERERKQREKEDREREERQKERERLKQKEAKEKREREAKDIDDLRLREELKKRELRMEKERARAAEKKRGHDLKKRSDKEKRREKKEREERERKKEEEIRAEKKRKRAERKRKEQARLERQMERERLEEEERERKAERERERQLRRERERDIEMQEDVISESEESEESSEGVDYDTLFDTKCCAPAKRGDGGACLHRTSMDERQELTQYIMDIDAEIRTRVADGEGPEVGIRSELYLPFVREFFEDRNDHRMYCDKAISTVTGLLPGEVQKIRNRIRKACERRAGRVTEKWNRKLPDTPVRRASKPAKVKVAPAASTPKVTPKKAPVKKTPKSTPKKTPKTKATPAKKKAPSLAKAVREKQKKTTSKGASKVSAQGKKPEPRVSRAQSKREREPAEEEESSSEGIDYDTLFDGECCKRGRCLVTTPQQERDALIEEIHTIDTEYEGMDKEHTQAVEAYIAKHFVDRKDEKVYCAKAISTITGLREAQTKLVIRKINQASILASKRRKRTPAQSHKASLSATPTVKPASVTISSPKDKVADTNGDVGVKKEHALLVVEFETEPAASQPEKQKDHVVEAKHNPPMTVDSATHGDGTLLVDPMATEDTARPSGATVRATGGSSPVLHPSHSQNTKDVPPVTVEPDVPVAPSPPVVPTTPSEVPMETLQMLAGGKTADGDFLYLYKGDMAPERTEVASCVEIPPEVQKYLPQPTVYPAPSGTSVTAGVLALSGTDSLGASAVSSAVKEESKHGPTVSVPAERESESPSLGQKRPRSVTHSKAASFSPIGPHLRQAKRVPEDQ
ncbi:hypothetical protein KIPB_002498 [Kipferlia bialata]|uniref:Uncharacterized protein n=1 Tax=Kipferlia bialata TaxID=797122 RepID=A0A9K3CRI2_9EUKA|nr:hypothetical protein KIPB_002498 [Kipferlia bialata]|eukprot:g2498.t1